MSSSLREYGLPSCEANGVPTWKKVDVEGTVCPNCGADLCEVKVPIKMALLKGGEGTANYLGCPACPFASPSINLPKGEEP